MASVAADPYASENAAASRGDAVTPMSSPAAADDSSSKKNAASHSSMGIEDSRSADSVTPGKTFLTPNAAATWGYAVMFFLTALLALLFRYVYSFTVSLRALDSFDVCDGVGLSCYGNQAVYRFSFSLVVFFVLMVIVTAITPSMHRSWWFVKLLFWAGITVAWFFIPGTVFVVYREIARVMSFFYVVLQILILLNMAYSLHETLLAQMDPSNDGHDDNGMSPRTARVIYVVLFTLLFAASITGIALLYVYYGKCPLHDGLISMTLILAVFCWIVGLLAGRGVLVPSVLVAFNVMTTYQALQSNPDDTCNPFADRNVPVWQLVIMIAFNLLSLCWSATRAAQNTPSVLAGPAHKRDGEKSPAAAYNGEAAAEPSWWTFHLVMTLAAFYMAMLLTGWGAEHTDSKINNTDASEMSLWIKIASVITVYVLYLWTLIAPKLCPNRDFSS